MLFRKWSWLLWVEQQRWVYQGLVVDELVHLRALHLAVDYQSLNKPSLTMFRDHTYMQTSTGSHATKVLANKQREEICRNTHQAPHIVTLMDRVDVSAPYLAKMLGVKERDLLVLARPPVQHAGSDGAQQNQSPKPPLLLKETKIESPVAWMRANVLSAFTC